MRSWKLFPRPEGIGRRGHQQGGMGPPTGDVERDPARSDRDRAGATRRGSAGRWVFGVGAATVALALSACGGGGSGNSSGSATPPNSNTPPSTAATATTLSRELGPGAGQHCATTSGVTECVSDPSYFSASDPMDGTKYFARLTYSVANQSGQTISDVGGDMSVIDSSNQTIGDIGGPAGGGAGIPPDASNACFDSLDSNLSLVNGQKLTLPKPLCFEMSGPEDRVISVLDSGSSATISISGG